MIRLKKIILIVTLVSNIVISSIFVNPAHARRSDEIRDEITSLESELISLEIRIGEISLQFSRIINNFRCLDSPYLCNEYIDAVMQEWLSQESVVYIRMYEINGLIGQLAFEQIEALEAEACEDNPTTCSN